MLYDRWRQIARERHGQLALRDLATGEQWTFGDLAEATQSRPEPVEPVYPAGQGAGFVLDVLRGWRSGQIICPVEPGHRPPPLGSLPASIAHVKTTSATTGASRFVLFTGPQLMADAANIMETMGLCAEWPNLGVISLAHSYGFSNLVLPLLLHGIPLILVGSALPEAVRRGAASASGVTLAAVPALWGTWHEAGSIPANVRLAISAAAPLPLLLEQQIFERQGLKVHNFYGSTECGGIAYDRAAGPRRDETCAGAPMQNVDLSLDDRGCLVVRSPAAGETYWPDARPELGQGVFRTNDLATISDGIVYLRGRAGDQINVAGRKVSPEAIERVLNQHPSVRHCIVFGVPSPEVERGEMIVACLVAAGNVTGDRLRQFLTSHLPAWQVPRDWWFVDSLETNRRGKVSRAEWRKRYLGRRPAAQTGA
jgi:acyl-CoA synthetase (AMP-forming)/AMP-acid ligase II